MIERLEVTPGPGTVIRYGSVAGWASSSASAGLISFLAISARNLAGSPAGGRQLADHLVGVLQARDPEPHVPFVVIGPSDDGWAALLHGPVQVWDGVRWTTPPPSPGWLRSDLWPQPSLAVTFAGASAPPVSPDSLWDLEAGVVPGSGFVLLPAVHSGGGLGPVPYPAGAAAPGIGLEGPEPRTESPPAVPSGTAASGTGNEPLPLPHLTALPAQEAADPATEALLGGEPDEEPTGPEPVEASPPDERAEPQADTAGPPSGLVDLRSGTGPSRLVAHPPLPSGRTPGRPVPGAPVVGGVVCQRGHLNRPGMASCVRCGSAITGTDAYNVSGTRPALGCLVIDDGAVYRLDSGYLVGSDPERDPTVRGGLARPLVVAGPQVAASHAEIRLHDWEVVVTDRESPGGTFIYGPDSNAWEKLRSYEPQVLRPGTHIAFGQRVATFLTPWIPGSQGTAQPGFQANRDPLGSADQETRSRYLGQ